MCDISYISFHIIIKIITKKGRLHFNFVVGEHYISLGSQKL